MEFASSTARTCGRRIDGKRLALTQAEQAGDMVDIGIGQHHGADRRRTQRRIGARLQFRRLGDLLQYVGGGVEENPIASVGRSREARLRAPVHASDPVAGRAAQPVVAIPLRKTAARRSSNDLEPQRYRRLARLPIGGGKHSINVAAEIVHAKASHGSLPDERCVPRLAGHAPLRPTSWESFQQADTAKFRSPREPGTLSVWSSFSFIPPFVPAREGRSDFLDSHCWAPMCNGSSIVKMDK